MTPTQSPPEPNPDRWMYDVVGGWAFFQGPYGGARIEPDDVTDTSVEIRHVTEDEIPLDINVRGDGVEMGSTATLTAGQAEAVAVDLLEQVRSVRERETSE